MVEEKSNPAAATTGNIALEDDILEVSKANLFLIAYPVNNQWQATILDRNDIQQILQATKMTFNGRVYKFKRVPAGQFGRLSALVPVAEIMRIGQPVDEFINALKQQQ